jgi:hypothetical protein
MIVTPVSVVILREGGGSSIPEAELMIIGLWNTRSPAFAGDDDLDQSLPNNKSISRITTMRPSPPPP